MALTSKNNKAIFFVKVKNSRKRDFYEEKKATNPISYRKKKRKTQQQCPKFESFLDY